jgi:hypothetical protein
LWDNPRKSTETAAGAERMCRNAYKPGGGAQADINLMVQRPYSRL